MELRRLGSGPAGAGRPPVSSVWLESAAAAETDGVVRLAVEES